MFHWKKNKRACQIGRLFLLYTGYDTGQKKSGSDFGNPGAKLPAAV